jgi:hypothetical protein
MGVGIGNSELHEACRLLYGEERVGDARFLTRLELADLKQAYRRRSLETHPDRFLHLGLEYQQLYTELFQQVREAYEKLSGFLRLRSNAFSPSITPDFQDRQNPFVSWAPPSTNTSQPGNGGNSSQAYYRFDPASFFKESNPLPPWRLRLGEFLFYGGAISWNTLISAVIWQSRQRERLGTIALRWGWLAEEELIPLLLDRHRGERLGSILVRHQIVTPFQLKMLLIHQQQKQPKIGEFFVEQGVVPPFQLLPLIQFLQTRNQKYENPRRNI